MVDHLTAVGSPEWYLEMEREHVRQQAEAAGLTVEQWERRAEQKRAREEAARAELDRAERLRVVRSTEARITAEDAVRLAEGTLDRTAALAHVEAFAGSDARFLVLAGGTGIGKTVAAVTLCLETHRSEGRVRLRQTGFVIPAGQLARRVEPWSADREAGIEQLDLRRWHALVVDDLGTERQDPRFEAALFEAIDQRQDFGKTLVTTNLPAAQLRQRLDARVLDRLLAQGRIVEVSGKSLRRKGRTP